MSKMRVFELARDLNIPSKQLIQKMHVLGLRTDSNFHVLTDEQVEFIKSKVEAAAPAKKDGEGGRRGRVIRRNKDEGSTEENGNDADKRPRRIRKGRKLSGSNASETVKEETVAASEPEIENTPPVEETPAVEEAPVVPEPIVAEEPPAEKVVEEAASAPKAEETPAPPKEEPIEEKPVVEAKAQTPVEPKVSNGEKPKAKPEAGKKPASEGAGTSTSKKEKHAKKGKKRPESPPEMTEEGASRKDYKKDRKGGRFDDERASSDSRSKKGGKKVYIIGDEEENMDRNRRKRRRRDRQKNKPVEKKHTFNPRKKSIKIGNTISVGDLAGQIGIKVNEIIKKLMGLGVMATINQSINGETAELIAAEFSVEVELDNSTLEDVLGETKQEGDLEQFPRSPIVTIMGHVDHGKTSLLDKIRTSQVTEGEAGGITQHIGAYHVETEQGHITFLDTPGHEAFTAMRARGANVTDIVVLVVAADDGVQPQTVEAIHHAQAADVPIIVVINKIDKPDSNPARVQQELLEHALISEDLGGETIFVQASAKSGLGIDNLLEMIHLQSEILELHAPHEGRARGVIVESQISLGRGPVGTVLIQTGTLNVGDYYVVGETFGKVRAIFDDRGKAVESAGPSTPIEVLGFNSVPATGEQFSVLEDEKTARQIAETRAHKSKSDVASAQQKIHLENLFGRINTEDHVELKLLVKADVQGSAEALQSSLSQLGNEKVSVSFLHTATGNITENDVMLASASDAIIIGFNATLDNKARLVNIQEGVDIRNYSVIYDAIEDVKKALEGLLKPTFRDELTGRCEVRQIFSFSKAGKILGCYVTEGKLHREATVKVYRQEELVHEGNLLSLKRFKDDVREVANNYECGIVLDSDEIEVGDIVEAYTQIEEETKL